MAKKSVYQTGDYKEALKKSKAKIVDISQDFFGVEKTILFLGFWKKKVLEARGTPSKEDMVKFKETAKSYFYGLISPCVIESNEELFRENKYFKVLNHTLLIDLRKTKEELWNGLEKKSARWGVKTANKNNLYVEKNKFSKSDIAKFYKLYKESAEKGGFKAETIEFLESLIGKEACRLFLIKNKKEIIAGGLLLLDRENNYAILDLTASSEKGLKMQAMPLLYWEMILFSKENGFSAFDLGGYDTNAKEGDKIYKINKFKENFGGVVNEQPIFSTDKKYVLLRGILKKQGFMRNLYKKIV